MSVSGIFNEPAGWHWGRVTPRPGQFLRYGWAAPDGAKALCVIFPGLSEYGEKYFEVARELLDRKMAVAVIDWRGQGLSWRHLPDHDKRHHDDFALDVEDAAAFVAALDQLPTLEGLPKILLGHSMGGHIGLRFLHDLKDTFRCAVVTAPLFGINLPAGTEGPARLLAEAACRAGMGTEYAPGYGPWTQVVYSSNLNLLTSDYDHRMTLIDQLTKSPDLRMGGITIGWVRAALDSTRLTHDRTWLSAISTPVLTFISGRDSVVSNPAIRRGMAALPHGQTIEIDGALHEVMMETPSYRERFWQGFDGFVAKQIGPG